MIGAMARSTSQRRSARPGRSLSRRGFLQALGVGGAVLAGGPLLSACGTRGTGSSAERTRSAGRLAWSNWPLYLDTSDEDDTEHPTLTAFTKSTGIDVTYTEDIDDNEEFFGK